MTVKNIVDQVEALFGRQSQKLLMQFMNDGLNEISGKVKHYRIASNTDLISYQRWYDFTNENMMDLYRVEIKDTNDRYIMIPKLVDYHRLLRDDIDSNTTTWSSLSGSDDSLT